MSQKLSTAIAPAVIATAMFAVVLFTPLTGAGAQPCSNGEAEITLSMYRPEVGIWYEHTDACSFTAVRIGGKDHTPAAADYDGDGTLDAAVWSAADRIWQVRGSKNGAERILDLSSFEFISAESIPVPADYDGDGNADIALWHAPSGEWTLILSSNDHSIADAVRDRWGGYGDIPVQADYDGDGRADLAVFRPTENAWLILESGTQRSIRIEFGKAGEDVLAPGDYTGDGRADIAVFRRGTWFVRNSSTGETEPLVFGPAEGSPVPADYDGDGVIDPAVYHNGMWLIYESGAPRFTGIEFGSENDVPISLLVKKTF